MITTIFNTIFYKPLYNALVFLVGVIPGHDIGVAVIILTLLVQFVIFPWRHRSIVTQRKMKEIDPEIKKIKEQFKNNKEEQTKQIMALYRQHGINPFSGFLMLLLQLPIFIALYKLFSVGASFEPSNLYSFVQVPGIIQSKFLNIINITESNYILAFLAGLTQFFQMHLAMPKIKKDNKIPSSFQEQLAKSFSFQVRFIMPLFIFFIALKFSAAIALYWTTMNVFAIVHEAVVAFRAKKLKKPLVVSG